MHPHVSFHINGGPTAMPDKDFERVIKESEIALQVCTAGNLRTTLLCARLADAHGAFDRFIIATDTPTGSGIMPLGMLYTIAHLSSLTDMAPERFICAASGSNARVYGLDCGLLAPGKAADIVLIDAPDGGTQTDRAGRDQARRYRGHRRGRDRGRPAFCRPQPQYAGHHPQGARRGVARDAGFRGGGALEWEASSRLSARNRPSRHPACDRGDVRRRKCDAYNADLRAAFTAGMIYQQLINGLMLGASYALVAIGYTLIFGVLNLLYFAHGEVFMVGAFVGLFLVIYAGANIYGALAGAMVACALLGVLSVFVAIRPVPKDRPLAPLISTIGLTIVLQNLAVYFIGGQQLAFPETIKQTLYHVGPVTVSARRRSSSSASPSG